MSGACGLLGTLIEAVRAFVCRGDPSPAAESAGLRNDASLMMPWPMTAGLNGLLKNSACSGDITSAAKAGID